MNNKKLLLVFVIGLIVTSILFLQSQKPDQSQFSALKPVTDNLPGGQKEAIELVTPNGYLNTDEITIKELIGKKVILVDFWTYSCINCQRTTPYLNAWYDKYQDKGLEIIGVHTPEFEFEKDRDNVASAIEKFAIKYPVVQDNDYLTWRAYGNRYWPRKYLIDINGKIVYDHIGEGAYEETEAKIQELLEERMKKLGMSDSVDKTVVKPSGISERSQNATSPEVYFGASRNELLGEGTKFQEGEQDLKASVTRSLNTLYLDGKWNIHNEYAENKSKNARIIFQYEAKDVYMVASSVEGVTLRIKIDGKDVGELAGEDVKDGKVRVKNDQLYKLIQGEKSEVHQLEIIIENPGLKAFTFTFG
jgi:thiol-disulfide isomerase/thioredoxin